MKLIIERADILREHLKRKIADLLGTVECAENPRDKRDWYTACAILDRMQYLVPMSARLLVASVHCKSEGDALDIPGDYDTFDRVCGRMVWSHFQDQRRNLPRPPYGAVLFG